MFPSPAPRRDIVDFLSDASAEEPRTTARWEDALAIVSAVPGTLKPCSTTSRAPKPVGAERDLCRDVDKAARARFASQAGAPQNTPRSVPSWRAAREGHAVLPAFEEKTNSHCGWDTFGCLPAPSAKTEPTDYSMGGFLRADENTHPLSTRGLALSTGQRPSRFGVALDQTQSAYTPPSQPQYASRSVPEAPRRKSRRARHQSNHAASTSHSHSRMRSDDPPAPRRPRHSHMQRWERGLPQESLSRHTPHPAAGMTLEWQKMCNAARAQQMKMEMPR